MLSPLNRVHKLLALSLARQSSRLLARPVISSTFDDFPQSALNVAGEMLHAEGVRGTFYASLGLAGTTTSVGSIFTRHDLDKVLEDGHELGCHTFHHTSCRSVTASDFENDCSRNREAAAALFGVGLKNFSFPFGDITLAAKRAMAKQYVTCRSTKPGVNKNPADLAFLKANPIYPTTSLERVEKLILENTSRNGWLIFYTHDIVSAPSRFGCTPAFFRQVLLWALQSGAEILTVAQALGSLQDAPPMQSSAG